MAAPSRRKPRHATNPKVQNRCRTESEAFRVRRPGAVEGVAPRVVDVLAMVSLTSLWLGNKGGVCMSCADTCRWISLWQADILVQSSSKVFTSTFVASLPEKKLTDQRGG
jgi:hypothetical protein